MQAQPAADGVQQRHLDESAECFGRLPPRGVEHAGDR
jgi:hypothetical protein